MVPVQSELSGTRACSHVSHIAGFHRIQASPGFREAAHYTANALREAGLKPELISHPANESTQYWSQRMWQEWSCSKAVLKLCGNPPLILADYADCKMSLIQRSAPTPVGGINAEVVVLDRGDDKELYPELDLQGKLVLTDGDLEKVRRWAVEDRGAVGIISDRLVELSPIRHRFDLPDARQYTSFWWTGHEKRCFGFVLSPKLGDMLRKRAVDAQLAHSLDPTMPRYVTVSAEVCSKFYDGTIENVEAVIPGLSDEEVLVVAHLCHPQPSANDNASGAGTAIETARTLHELIASGRLPTPKRSIRFLFVAEMTGTYAYLASNPDRIPRTLAALNLDMVGGRQDLCLGPLVAEYPPVASDSFVGDLLAAVLDEVAQEVKNFNGTASYALFNHTTSPFSGGSDHYILSDPSVNIPCPMLIQWPDKYYHTSEDTIDKVDPEMLFRVGVTTAVYSYYLASLDTAGAQHMLFLCSYSYTKRLQALLTKSLTISQEIVPLREEVEFLLERQCNQLASLARYTQDSVFANDLTRTVQHLHAITELEWSRVSQHLHQSDVADTTTQVMPESEMTPVRVFPGPVSLRGHLDKLASHSQEEYYALSKKHGSKAPRISTEALYWANGERTIKDISALVKLNLGHTNTAYLVDYFRLLELMGLVRLENKQGRV